MTDGVQSCHLGEGNAVAVEKCTMPVMVTSTHNSFSRNSFAPILVLIFAGKIREKAPR